MTIMEKLNILDILKDKPKDTKLWSPIFGECTFDKITCDGSCVGVETKRKVPEVFYANGKYDDDGECTIFPSKQMRDWSKLAWKKGDVLRFSDILVIFEKWTKDDYTEFKAAYEFICHSDSFDKGNDYYTSEFCKVIDDVADNFIKKVEEHYGGKLNLKTLEIEQPKSKFKDGDIVYLNTKNGLEYVFAYDANKEMITSYIVAYCITLEDFAHIETQYICGDNMINSIHLAIDSEKQQLFDALAKENKAWDADKKMLVDLPKKYKLEPFDKVLVRITNIDVWNLNLFSYDKGVNSHYRYICISGSYFQCIPYNDQTKHLLGTTDEWKGGEG